MRGGERHVSVGFFQRYQVVGRRAALVLWSCGWEVGSKPKGRVVPLVCFRSIAGTNRWNQPYCRWKPAVMTV